MSALLTRGTIVAGQDYSLTPVADQKDEPELLAELLQPWQGREAEATRIFLPEDLPTDGSQPAEDKAIIYGFTTSHQRNVHCLNMTFTAFWDLFRKLSERQVIMTNLCDLWGTGTLVENRGNGAQQNG